ncbi:MAG TPA: hypothetical protein VKV95_22460 [Terriglobia bacterium]|nr:hypothetical protein [Terriglobia bacterium]
MQRKKTNSPSRAQHRDFSLLLIAFGTLALLPTLVPDLLAQSSSVPYGTQYGPMFLTSSASYKYPSTYKSIHEVDFRNLSLHTFGRKGKSLAKYNLKDGTCETDDQSNHCSIELESIHYLRTTTGIPELALVAYGASCVAGSSNTEGIAQTFKLEGHHLEVIQDIAWDENHGEWTTHSFDEKTNTLVIRSSHYIPGDAHCCVSAIDDVSLLWNGSRFVQAGISTELSPYGKQAGKTLDTRMKGQR